MDACASGSVFASTVPALIFKKKTNTGGPYNSSGRYYWPIWSHEPHGAQLIVPWGPWGQQAPINCSMGPVGPKRTDGGQRAAGERRAGGGWAAADGGGRRAGGRHRKNSMGQDTMTQ